MLLRALWVYPIFLIIVIGTRRSHQRTRSERQTSGWAGRHALG